MPKLKEVEISENLMSWNDVIPRTISRSIVVAVPKRELKSFLEKGKKIKKIIIEFS